MTGPRTLDELAVALSALRSDAGSPSYAEIARRIAAVHGEEPAKVTVYDCFRPGRRRIDPALVRRIVQALGAGDAAAQAWQATATALNGGRHAAHVQVLLGPRGEPGHRIGRESELAALPDADVLIFSGLPGSGKSTLASALVAGRDSITVELRESEVDRPPAGPVDVLRSMLGSMGVRSSPYELARLRERIAHELADRIVVLEDAGSVERLAALIVPGVRYVVTTRSDLSGVVRLPGLRTLRTAQVTVAPLAPDASLRLLSHLLDAPAARERSDAERGEEAMRRIVAVSGGLPLDIAMLAGVVREHPGWTFDDLASRFESESRDARIRPVLEAATRAVSETDAELLADAALLDREVDVPLLRAVHPAADAAIARLRSRHLLEAHDGGVQMHATVFAYVRDRSMSLRPESERRRSVQRFADALTDRIIADPDAAARDIATVLAVAEAAREHGLDAVCEGLALRTGPVLAQWTLWEESLRLHDLAARGRDLTDIPDLALGIAHSAEKLGRLDEALVILHRVRRVARGSALARTWNQIGNVQRWMSRFDDALAAYSTAIAVAREHQDGVVAGRATGNHADTLRILARYDEAERGYAQALDIATGAGDEINIGIVRGNRALMQISMGLFPAAEQELEHLISAAGDKAVLHLRTTRALLLEARGDDTGAAALLDEVLTIDSGTGEYGPSADLLLLRARLDARAGRTTDAIRVAQSVLDEARRSGTPLVSTEAANTLAEIHIGAGAADLAELCAQEAAGIAEATGDAAEVARARRVLALVAAARGDERGSALLRESADRVYREIGHRLGAVSIG